MILQLPSTSLSGTFGLIAQPLPCTSRNVYMRVRACQRASVTRMYAANWGKLTLSQKAMHWTIIIAYIFITNLPKSVDLPRRSSGKGSKFCEILVFRNSYMSMLQCYNEDDKMHIGL